MLNFRKRLNPIINRVDRILDFSDIKPTDKLLIEEYQYLKPLLLLLSLDVNVEKQRLEIILNELEEFAVIVEKYTGNDKEDTVADYKNYVGMAKNKIENINILLSQIDYPYFGKVIFDRKQSENLPSAKVTSYIGKFAYYDKKTNAPLIMDWRAPIANLYYNNAGPKKDVSISSPIGVQKGDLLKKVQFDISEGRIKNIYDITTGNSSADEFLLSQLKRKIGKKLTDIVSTIQEQQNIIIREKNNVPMILQGVAGSGKTTILLHRIAYLLFNNKEELNPDNCMIIGPNKLFIDYISDVLPSLGVHKILKNTYLLWGKNALGWDDNYKLSDEKDNYEIKKFKGSSEFINIINDFFKDFVADLFDKMPDSNRDSIYARYNELLKEHKFISLKEGVMLSAEYVYTRKQLKRATVGSFLGDVEINNEKLRAIKLYVNKRIDPLRLYREFFKLEYIFESRGLSKDFIKILRNYSLKTLKTSGKEKFYKIEDLAPIVYLNQLINGNENKYDYIAVDEAQDMSVFQHLTLYLSAKNGNINFAGDLAQSIVPPFYIQDWNDLISTLNTDVKLFQLDKCYRTTIEIVNFASKIFKKHFPASFKAPQAVLRHGDDVSISYIKQDCSSEDTIKNIILPIASKEFENNNISSLAVLCKDYKHADIMYEKLSDYKKLMNFKLTNYNEDDYKDGLLVMPIERAKGLEFDAVMIVDLDANHYPNDILSAKLLYVAITRALHRVYVLTKEEKNDFITK